MINVLDVLYSMKLECLKILVKVFEIKVNGNKKKDFIEAISLYLKNNIIVILKDFIIYEEWEIIKKICDNNFEIINDNIHRNKKAKNSLLFLGIAYSYDENYEKKISIPLELRDIIKSNIDDINLINYSKNKQKIVNMINDLLELYGVITLDLLIDYIVRYTGEGYRIHQVIKMLSRYNERNKLYYQDENCNYYNVRILNRDIMNNINNNINLKYKYYSEIKLANSNKEINHYEKEIYVILNRYYNNSELTNKVIENIKYMLKNNISSNEISLTLVKQIKGISEFGRKRVEKLINILRDECPLWGFKGYSLKELRNIDCSFESFYV